MAASHRKNWALKLAALSISFLSAAAQQPSASNRTMTVRLRSTGGPQLEIRDTQTRETQTRETQAAVTLTSPDLFRITLQSGAALSSAQLHWTSRFAEAANHQTCAQLSDPTSGATFHWCLLAQPDRSYMREQLTISAGAHDIPIRDVQLLDFADASAHVEGTVKGSPIADDHIYFGVENPLSWSRVAGGRAQAGITRELPLRAGQSVTYSAVIGTYAPGQLRRSFLAYIEAERPRPYKPFLNYNTWYDIGYTNRYSEADVLDRIHAFGTELVEKRHVQMDSFVLDDGWDDPNTLWSFDKGFPNGLTRVSQAAAAFHSGIGIWLSPWGGYMEQKVERVAFGKAHGYEIMKGGFALSGPKYFHVFSDTCAQLVARYHVNLFKFDGTGNANRVFPGSMFDSDFAAAIHLIGELRRQEPGIFINLTTGTYPSPFWLLDADSIWRGGDDHSFAGVGSKRQQWITYRDAQTYRNIVQGGPLFPLNSLMLHGMIYAQRAEGLNTDPGHDFPDEVLSYFGSGTQLQEMYVTPSLLSAADWDILARAAKWSRANADILEDTHWIGGDPGQLEVYGWAAWSPRGWTVTLRNPSDKPQTYALTPGKALELPPTAAHSFSVQQPFAQSSPTRHWEAAQPVQIALKPFEVRIYQSNTSH